LIGLRKLSIRLFVGGYEVKIFEGAPRDLLSKDVQDLIASRLIVAFISHHNLYPSEDSISYWRGVTDYSLYADEFFSDEDCVRRTFFPQFYKELVLNFSGKWKGNRICLKLKHCNQFPAGRFSEEIYLKQDEVGKTTIPDNYTVSITSWED